MWSNSSRWIGTDATAPCKLMMQSRQVIDKVRSESNAEIGSLKLKLATAEKTRQNKEQEVNHYPSC